MNSPIWTNSWACQHYELWKKLLSRFVGVESHALEIGCHEGRSSCFFTANILCHEKSTLTCVDPFLMGSKERFHHNIKALKCDAKIRLVESKSDAADLWSNAWSFIYIDGDHCAKAALFDAVRSWGALKKGGLMIWDDYKWRINELPRRDCPKLGIDMFLQICEKEMKILHIGNQVIVEKTSACSLQSDP